ncbi:MAG: hypothetical protein ACYDCK_00455 [Thermoplasmatota archaeon]
MNISAYPPPSMGRYPVALASFDETTAPPDNVAPVATFDPTPNGAKPNVYVGTSPLDDVYALASGTGTVLWHTTIGDNILALGGYPSSTTPLLIVAHGDPLDRSFTVDALDPATGADVRTCHLTPSGHLGALAVDAANSRLYFAASDAVNGDMLYCYQIASTPVPKGTVGFLTQGDSFAIGAGNVNPSGNKPGVALADTVTGNIAVKDWNCGTQNTMNVALPGILAVAPAGDVKDGEVLVAWSGGIALLKKNANDIATDYEVKHLDAPTTAAIGRFMHGDFADVAYTNAARHLIDFDVEMNKVAIDTTLAPLPGPKPAVFCPDPLSWDDNKLGNVLCTPNTLAQTPRSFTRIASASGGNWLAAGLQQSDGTWIATMIPASTQQRLDLTDVSLATANAWDLASTGTSSYLASGNLGSANLDIAMTAPAPASLHRWTVNPVSVFSGLLTQSYITPANGFEGSTLLRCTIAWQQTLSDGTLLSETVNFLDWLHLTFSDGTWPDVPSYSVGVSTWQREWGPATSRDTG